MGKIVIGDKNKYTIDIEKDGEIVHQIVFYLDDINLQTNCLNAYEYITNATKEFEEKTKGFENKEINEDNREILKQYLEIQEEYYKDCRKVIDMWLGENTCAKIFGETNSPYMFTQLLEGLIPEMENMGVKKQKLEQTLYKKYAPSNRKVLK